ncbi:hypothetical protein ACFL2R_04160, partial [Patescibacteria group bacterium]
MGNFLLVMLLVTCLFPSFAGAEGDEGFVVESESGFVNVYEKPRLIKKIGIPYGLSEYEALMIVKGERGNPYVKTNKQIAVADFLMTNGYTLSKAEKNSFKYLPESGEFDVDHIFTVFEEGYGSAIMKSTFFITIVFFVVLTILRLRDRYYDFRGSKLISGFIPPCLCIPISIVLLDCMLKLATVYRDSGVFELDLIFTLAGGVGFVALNVFCVSACLYGKSWLDYATLPYSSLAVSCFGFISVLGDNSNYLAFLGIVIAIALIMYSIGAHIIDKSKANQEKLRV